MTAAKRFIDTLLSRYGSIIIIVVLGIIVTALAGPHSLLRKDDKPNMTPTFVRRQVVSKTLPLQEIWRRSLPMIVDNSAPPKLLTQNGLVILAVETKHSYNQIVALNSQSGDLVWETKPIFGRPNSLSADEKKVYLGYYHYVKALDLKTGQKLWEGLLQSEWKKGRLDVYAKNKQLEVYDIDTKDFPLNTKLWLLDPQTGKTLEMFEVPTIFFHDAGNYYLSNYLIGSFGARLITKDKATGTELWQLHTTGLVRRWPIIIDDLMYLDAGDVYAINISNGEIQWSYEDADTINPDTADVYGQYENLLIQKIAYGKDVLYFVKSDGTIVGLNPRTGQEIGKIEVSPPPVFYDEEGFLRGVYYLIAASDKYVAVYYGDNQELIVFERTEATP